jgi:phenylpropionate dioxygenase-like ring-hydroxylating dioxygenase large terminal subunit
MIVRADATNAAETTASLGELRPAPAADRFPAWPASWYLFGESGELRKGPLSKRILGRDLVAYRTQSGRAAVMEARCAHLGADLGNGKVVGECLRCPFHEWEYGPDGRCTRVPRSESVPEFARVLSYPVVERHGLLFFFNGRRPLFPLPFFAGEKEEDYRAARPCGFTARCTWFMVTAHGFDLQHFETVHGRKLLGPLEVDSPAPLARRSRYRAEVLGEKLYDRFLRRAVGREVEITITTWGGTFVVITGDFGGAKSRFLIVTQPQENGHTRCEIVVFARRRKNRLIGGILEPATLWLRKFLTHAYLIDESQSLGSPQYNPHSLTELDRDMIEFFHWAASLPEFPDSWTA